MKRSGLLSLSWILLLPFSAPWLAMAADSSPETEAVIVTATRTARTVDETLAAVTVITRQDIERQQAQNLQELLSGLPGMTMTNYGGSGKPTSLFLRGTNSDHVLVLIDGIKMGSATLATTAFEHFPMELIDRIEIVRGPRSSLYGSEAIGGVVQIFTRKGGGESKPSFSIGGGSYRTVQSSAGLAGGGSERWFNLGMSTVDSGGFNSCRGVAGSFSQGCGVAEPDRDGYRNLAGTARGGFRLANGTELDFHWLRSKGHADFDGAFQNETNTIQQVLGGSVRGRPMAAWHMSLTAGRTLDLSDNFKDGVFASRFNTTRDVLSLQNDLELAEHHLLTVGLDYQIDHIDSDTAYLLSSRENKAIFGHYQTTLGHHDFQVSLREDDNQQFGQRSTGGVAWGYPLQEDLRLTASYGTAFKAPSFNQLYYPWGLGNPNLKPESSRSMEMGLHGGHWGKSWGIHLFQTDVEDLILSVPPSYATANIDSARIRGVEFTAGYRLAQWKVDGSVTLLDPVNSSSGANGGHLLPRRSRESFRLEADRDREEGFAWGATLRGEGARYDDPANTNSLGGYATLDLRGEYAMTKEWSVQGKVVNLLDKDYETALFYAQPGRSAFVLLRYQPGK